jgi:acyl carrier protein
MIEIAFWFFAALVLYVYVGYPALLFLFSRLRSTHARRLPEDLPTVTMLISAFNEEDCIAEKLENSLRLDYPRELLQIIVLSDQSSDRTDEIVSGFAGKGIELMRMEERGGKTLGLNTGVAASSSDFVVFSDANAMYRSDAIRALIAPFSEQRIGAVVGASTYADIDSDVGESESLYWRYEIAIKILESRLSSVVGGDGAIYAVRRSLFQPMGAAVLSDFVNPLQVVEQGFQCVYEPNAISVEEVAGSFEKEFSRKVRIVNRAWRATMSMKRLLNPLRYGFFAWQYISHKLLRWLVPAFLVLVLLTNVLLLASHSVYVATLLAQLAFYALATAGAVLRKRSNLGLILYVPYYFCLVNIASARGIAEAYRGKTYTTWSTARADEQKSIDEGEPRMKANPMIDNIRDILRSTLQLGDRADQLTAESPLMGAIPEFDSMAVVTVLTMVEEEFGVEIDDDEVSADIFETVGSLVQFVAEKTGA